MVDKADRIVKKQIEGTCKAYGQDVDPDDKESVVACRDAIEEAYEEAWGK